MTSTKREKKAWGQVSHCFNGNGMNISLLEVEAGGFSSRHFHKHRFNRFYVHSGMIEVETFDPDILTAILAQGDSFTVPPGVIHRFRVIEKGIVLEFYWTEDGTPCELDDIERLDTGGMKGRHTLTLARST